MNQGWTYSNQVNRFGVGLTVLDFYVQRYPHSSREVWQQRIETGQVLLDGQQTSTTRLLAAGQTLTYHRPPWQEPAVPLKFSVLFEDTDVLMIEKPSGLPVLPGGGFVEHTLLHLLQMRFPKNTPRPIHRLGRGTSGVMLLARSQQARAHLSQQMRDQNIQKVYRALIAPDSPKHPLANQFDITHEIGKVSYPGLGYVYAATSPGLTAHSACQVLHRHQDGTILAVAIRTGRPHQIRIHLAAIGYPLVGDPLYGPGGQPYPSIPSASSQPVPGDCGYHLHAFSLQFNHPKTGRTIKQVSPPPPQLRR